MGVPHIEGSPCKMHAPCGLSLTCPLISPSSIHVALLIRYAVTFEAGGRLELFTQGTYDVIRRRRWYRTMRQKPVTTPVSGGGDFAAGVGVSTVGSAPQTLNTVGGAQMTMQLADPSASGAAVPVITEHPQASAALAT